MAANARVWLITGCSSGFGRGMTQYVLSRGDNVVATLRDASSPVLDDLKAAYPAALRVVPLDVTNPDQVASAFASAHDAFGAVDVVFNNAGSALVAEVESTPPDAARALFETNFWGACNVNVEAVRFFRERSPPGRGGRLLVNNSFLGLSTMPCLGFYNASKFASEALTQTMASELEPSWNIKVTIVDFGFYRTDVSAKAVHTPPLPAYAAPDSVVAPVRPIIAAMFAPDGGVQLGDVAKGVRKVYDLAGMPAPPLRIVLGKAAIEAVRGQLRAVSEAVDTYEDWSDDLLEDVPVPA